MEVEVFVDAVEAGGVVAIEITSMKADLGTSEGRERRKRWRIRIDMRVILKGKRVI